MVPHLTTALTGPINELEARILESMPAIERWFRLEWMEHTPPFYSSVGLRNAGFKLAPVGTELFPGGFNHLTPAMLPLAVQATMAAIEKICPEAKNLLLIPGSETANPLYLLSLQRLVRVFNQAGLNVRLGTLDDNIKSATELDLPNGGSVVVEPLVRTRGRLGLKDFDPCTILLNNDLAAGTPRVLQHLHEQYLLPPLHASRAVRRKSRHFQSYEEVAKKFAKLLGMDAWLINPMFASCALPDGDASARLDSLRSTVDALLNKLRRKYKEYGISDKPYVVIKPEQSGPALGVVPVREARDVDNLAALAEPGASSCVVQEGVPTFERIQDLAAEPLVYMIDRYVVGGYYRTRAGCGADDSLSASDSAFVPLAFAETSQLPRPGVKPGASAPNRFYMYGVIGRLAMLAAAYELEATDPDAESYD